MKAFLIAAGMFALSACVAAQPVQTVRPLQVEEWMTAAIEVTVSQALKDPESARYGTILVGESARGYLTVCGLVNAKNSFGGYTGMTPFIGTLQYREKGGQFALIALGGSDVDTQALLTTCDQLGLPLRRQS